MIIIHKEYLFSLVRGACREVTTNVYAVVKVCGKQIKFGAKTKCFPDVKQPKTYEKEKCEKME